jgi:hypothetical protein
VAATRVQIATTHHSASSRPYAATGATMNAVFPTFPYIRRGPG